MQTIPYHLFHARKPRKIRSKNNREFYEQLVGIYANRYAYESSGISSHYLYSANTSRPIEIIEPINLEFIYNYLKKHNPQSLVFGHGHTLTFEEYKSEIDIYFMVMNNILYEGGVVNLPHFLGIIKVQSLIVKKYNRFAKRKIDKKIVTLHWQKKYFESRLLNVVQPRWFSVKIKDKVLLNRIYINMMAKGYLYDIGFDELKSFSKKI